MRVEIIQDLQSVADRVLRAAAVPSAAAPGALARAAEETRALGVGTIRAHTPVGDRADGDASEHLRDTTEAVVEAGADQASVLFAQTKTIVIRGDDVPLDLVLTDGRAGGYDVYPVTKKALYWPGAAHPVGHSRPGPAAPNPYLREATDEMRAPVELIARDAGAQVQIQILEAMRA